MGDFFSRILGSQREARMVQQARISGPMPWVIAIMIALTVLVAAFGLGLRATSQQVSRDIAGGVTIQIINADAAQRKAQADAVTAAVKSVEGVASVTLVPEAELRELVDPWLATSEGDGADGEDGAIPIPALVDVKLAGRADAAAVNRIEAAVKSAAPNARVDAQGAWLAPVFDLLTSLQWLALALIALLVGATAAAVVLASRAALGSHGETIEIIHMLGGTDAQIARIFQRRVAFDALLGGAVGFAGAVLVAGLLGKQLAAVGSGLAGNAGLDWHDWLLLALIPLAGIGLALLTARITVMRALKKML